MSANGAKEERAARRTGVVVALQVRPATGGPTEPVDRLELTPERGILGDHAARNRRQITILSEEAWSDAVSELGRSVPWQARRANVLVRGLDLAGTAGCTLELGECAIRIHGETRPCQVMDDAAAGLKAALVAHWRGGIHGEVLRGGTVRPGDPAALARPA